METGAGSKLNLNFCSKAINKMTSSPPSPSPLGDCVVMSLRGSETTEAISQGIENREIATLPLVARNDKKGIMTQSLEGEGWGG